jgi:uncharacterized protein YbcV (DUF1398 family)
MTVDAATGDALSKIWGALLNPTSGIDTPTFPATIAALAELGVNRYRVDFVAKNITSYVGTEVDVYSFPVPQETPAGTVKWSTALVTKAIKKAQDKAKEGRADFAEFERDIVAGGVSEYTVYFGGKKVVYASVLGDVFQEAFPGVQANAKADARRLREAVGMVDI